MKQGETAVERTENEKTDNKGIMAAQYLSRRFRGDLPEDFVHFDI